jgi:hypothetical protein
MSRCTALASAGQRRTDYTFRFFLPQAAAELVDREFALFTSKVVKETTSQDKSTTKLLIEMQVRRGGFLRVESSLIHTKCICKYDCCWRLLDIIICWRFVVP